MHKNIATPQEYIWINGVHMKIAPGTWCNAFSCSPYFHYQCALLYLEEGTPPGTFSFYILNNCTCMLTIASFLVGVWFLALLFSYTLGGFIHLLLVVAIVMALVRILEGENPLRA